MSDWPRPVFSIDHPDAEEIWRDKIPCPGCGIAIDQDAEFCATCSWEISAGIRCADCGLLHSPSKARPDEPTCTCGDSVSQGNDEDQLPF